MKDEAKTKAQLIAELTLLRRRVTELEALAAEYQQIQQIAEERQQNQRRMAQLEALRQISLELTTELDLDTLLNSIVLRAIELLEGTAGSIYLYRPEHGTLELIVTVGNPAVPRGVMLRRGEGLSGKVFEMGKPLMVENYQEWSGRAAFFNGYAFNTAMAVPIQLGQEFLGTVNVVNRPTPFSLADAELLSLFATQAAIAIRNTQLVASLQESEQSYKTLFRVERRQAQELYLLEQVRTALARELDLPTILRISVETIAETFGYTQVSIYLLEGDVSVLQHQVGYDQVIARIPITQGVSGQVVRTGQPVLIKDVHTHPDFLGAIEGLVSEICVPLFNQGQVVGFFNIESSQGVTLDEADLRLMVALSEHINLAISRARLYTEARESAERFRQLAENIHDVFWITNLDDTETIYVSPAYEDLWGRPLQRIYEQPRSWLEAVHPEDRARVAAQFECRDRSKPAFNEYRIMRPDGVVRWVRERSFPVLNESGEVYRVAGIIEDITQRKQTEEALRGSEERFRSLFEDSPIPLWEEDFSAVKAYLDQLRDQGVMDFEAYFEQRPEAIRHCVSLIRLIDANQASLKMSQAKDKAEALSSLDRIITSDSLKAFKQELMAVAQGKTKLEYENTTQNLSGARVHTNITWTIAPGYEETYAKVLISIIDITELKRAEEALRESEQRHRELALHNAQLYTESQKRLKEQTALLEATTVISSTLDSPTVLRSIAEQMGRAIDATSAYICSYDPETMTSAVLAEYLSSQASAAEQVSDLGVTYDLPRDLPIAFAFMQSDKLTQFQHADDSDLPEAERKHLQQFGACTTLIIRLQVGGELLGYAALWESRRRREFTAEETALCQGIAQQAAIAIQNARLLEQARQDAETKAMLLEEVNHRVKNNLTSIIGLLYAERQHKVSAESQTTLDEIIQDLINRVQGLATAHSLLSAAEWGPLSLSELARQIIASTVQSLPPDRHVIVEVSPSSVRVSPQQANNLALIINELTTNTIKYGLLEQGLLQITIKIDREDGLILFEFKNSGSGYPPEVLKLARHNAGIYLIQNLVRKGLHGEISLRNDGGAVTTIRFPASLTLKG